MKRTFIAVICLVAILIIAIFYVSHRTSTDAVSGDATSTNATTTTELSLDQIFTEASQQLGFAREQVMYFNIYGQDRVQFSAGNGVTFAYKTNGTWHIAGPVGNQEVPECKLLVDVPEQYRQACYEVSTDENLYIDPVDGQNINYPTAQRVKYIGL